MKKLLLLFSLLAITIACSSDDESKDLNNDGTLFFSSYEKYELSTGEEKERSLKVAFVQIWNADGKDFDFEKSSSDIFDGFLWDKTSNKSFKRDYITMYTSSFSLKLKPGRYAIVVIYDKDQGFERSHTYFEIKNNESTSLKKYFKRSEVGQIYAPW